MQFDTYHPQDYSATSYDEYFAADGAPRPAVKPILHWFRQQSSQNLTQIDAAAQTVLRELGATFSVGAEERVLPFDPIPRVISAAEWQHVATGLKQRVRALNRFCADIYGEEQILQAGIIPREIVTSARRYLPACQGMQPPQGIWCHISGIDLVRDRHGQWCVLEDNVREPSGIAYVLKNRQAMQQVVPELLKTVQPQPAGDYAQHLQTVLSTFQAVTPGVVGILTTGPSSSSYFEHVTLAEQMQVPLVRPEDLAIREGALHYRSDRGWQRLAGLYRRGDTELFDDLDLGTDYPDSLAAIIELCQQGQLAIANAIGAGIADDKVIYAYVPDIIRFYLSEEPILPNVQTYLCWRESDREYVLNHLDKLVVKAASAEGGDDMLIGMHATEAERAVFADKIRQRPRAYMAQPTVSLSQIPTVIEGQVVGRHTDLRPFVIHQGNDLYVYPGGLTRVALEAGQLVVNSSQGGGSKDTWILA